jgi:hypothetical protein
MSWWVQLLTEPICAQIAQGVSMAEIEAAGGCPRGSINALKDGPNDVWQFF